jgi:hypothetical protein
MTNIKIALEALSASELTTLAKAAKVKVVEFSC